MGICPSLFFIAMIKHCMNKENLGRKVFSWLIDYILSLKEAKAGVQGRNLDA